MTVSEAVTSGNKRESLEAIRAKLAAELDGAGPREAAALAKQLTDVIEKLDAIPVAKGSVSDDLRTKRADRLAKAARLPRPPAA